MQIKPLLIFEDKGFKNSIPVSKNKIQKIITSSIDFIKDENILDFFQSNKTEFSINFISNTSIAKLNKEFRSHDYATNILSFPNNHDALTEKFLGDLALCLDLVYEESYAQGKSIDNHLIHLILHGFLHLLNFDHQHADEAKNMEDIEIKTLHKFNIPNPYD